jgi:hypothetical protein
VTGEQQDFGDAPEPTVRAPCNSCPTKDLSLNWLCFANFGVARGTRSCAWLRIRSPKQAKGNHRGLLLRVPDSTDCANWLCFSGFRFSPQGRGRRNEVGTVDEQGLGGQPRCLKGASIFLHSLPRTSMSLNDYHTSRGLNVKRNPATLNGGVCSDFRAARPCRITRRKRRIPACHSRAGGNPESFEGCLDPCLRRGDNVDIPGGKPQGQDTFTHPNGGVW